MRISKYFKKGDILIFISIIIIGILPYLFLNLENENGSKFIAIYQDNKLIHKFELNKGEESKFINFDFYVSGEKYIGRLETKNSMVRLLRLPEEVVPKSIHSDINWISDSKKIIVALPVSLVVSIENGESKVDLNEVDVVSY